MMRHYVAFGDWHRGIYDAECSCGLAVTVAGDFYAEARIRAHDALEDLHAEVEAARKLAEHEEFLLSPGADYLFENGKGE